MSKWTVVILAFGKHADIMFRMPRGPIALLEEDGNCLRAPPLSPPWWQVLSQDEAPSPGDLLEADHMALLGHLEYLCLQLLGEVSFGVAAMIVCVIGSTNVVSHNQAMGLTRFGPFGHTL